MKARDIMVRDVITVHPDTLVRDIACLMVEKHISGVPVLSDNRKLVGMVSQSDLLHRADVGRSASTSGGFAFLWIPAPWHASTSRRTD